MGIRHTLGSAALALLLTTTAAADDRLDALVARAAALLAEQGYGVDTERLTIEVRDRGDLEDDFGRQPRAKRSFAALAAFGAALGEPSLTGDEIHAGVLDRAREHVAASYAPHREAIVFRSDSTQLLALPGMTVHELVHAHQHQQRDMDAVRAACATTIDAIQALRCLTEGEAQAVTILALQREEDPPADYEAEFLGPELWQGEVSSLPYIAGARLLLPVLTSAGRDGVQAIYDDGLPLTTEQVLHPDKLGTDLPTPVVTPDGDPDPALTIVEADSLGELALCLMFGGLGAAHHAARVGAAGWDGDRLVVYRDAEGREVLLWRSVWDREVDARQVAELLADRGVETQRHGRVLDLISSEHDDLSRRLSNALAALPLPVPGDDGVATTADFESRFGARHAPDPLWAIPDTDLVLLIPRGWWRVRGLGGREMLLGPKLGGESNPTINVTVKAATGRWPPDLAWMRQLLEKQYDVEMLELDPVTEIPTLRMEGRSRADLRRHHYIVRLWHGGHQVTLTASATKTQWKQLKTAMREALESVVPAL